MADYRSNRASRSLQARKSETIWLEDIGHAHRKHTMAVCQIGCHQCNLGWGRYHCCVCEQHEAETQTLPAAHQGETGLLCISQRQLAMDLIFGSPLQLRECLTVSTSNLRDIKQEFLGQVSSARCKTPSFCSGGTLGCPRPLTQGKQRNRHLHRLYAQRETRLSFCQQHCLSCTADECHSG